MLYSDIPKQARLALEGLLRNGAEIDPRLRISRGDGVMLLSWHGGPSYLQLLGQFFNNGVVDGLNGNYFYNRGGGMGRGLRFESPPNMAPFWLTPEESQQMELLFAQRDMVMREMINPIEAKMEALRLMWDEVLPGFVPPPPNPDGQDRWVPVPDEVRGIANRLQRAANEANNAGLWRPGERVFPEGPEVIWADDEEDEEGDE